MKYPSLYYSEYLKLDELLAAQHLKSVEFASKGQGNEHGEAHDETLFIIIHQVYELWFKQILHEMGSVYKMMDTKRVIPNNLSVIVHRLQRICEIQRILNDQLKVIETMTPLDFMEFRDFLVPASGFMSVQFRQIELTMGLRQKHRLSIDQQFFNSRLKEEDKKLLLKAEEKATLLELVDAWLARMPFAQTENYDFWQQYQIAVTKMLDDDQKIIESNKTLHAKQIEMELNNLRATRNTFAVLFDEKKYTELYDKGIVRISRKAKLAAIFINLFRDEPVLQLPYAILTQLLEIDENFTTWRYKHAIMAHRMLGAKIGTGGSSGHEYLKKATENNRVYLDFFNLATFLIPRKHMPKLPAHIINQMGFANKNA
jgi:tryptophan 2,3-dioxygenase